MSKRTLHLWGRHVQTCTVCSDVKVNRSPYCDPMCSRNDRHLGKVLKTGGCESSNTCCMSDCQICLKPIKACPTKDTSQSIVTHIHPHPPHVSHVENHITIIPQLSRHCNHCSGQPGVSGNELPSYLAYLFYDKQQKRTIHVQNATVQSQLICVFISHCT